MTCRCNMNIHRLMCRLEILSFVILRDQKTVIYFLRRLITIFIIFSLLIFRFSFLFIFDFRFILHRHLLFHFVSLLSLILFSRFLAPLHAQYRTRWTKESVTPQLAKLLIYSLFNQTNERADALFYAFVQLFMVYGNCPKQTCIHRSWLGPYKIGLRVKHAIRATALFRRILLARLFYILYHFLLALLSTRFFIFPFRVRPAKAAFRVSN